MLWLLAAVLAMVFRTARNVLNKNVLQEVDSLSLATVVSLFAAIIYSPIFAFSVANNSLFLGNISAYGGILASAFFNSLGIYLLMQGLKTGDVSIVVSLRNIVPLFALVWGVMLLGETVSLVLIPATVLVVAGVILLHMKQGMDLSLKRKSSFYSISAAFIFSLAITADKYVVGFIKPLNYVLFLFIFRFLFLLIFLGLDNKLDQFRQLIASHWRPITVISALSAGSFFCILTALSLAKVTLVAPVLRVEVLFSALAGGYFFKEENLKLKLVGAGLLMLGLVLVVS